MRRSEKKLLITEIVLCVIFLLNIFVKNVLSDRVMLVSLIAVSVLLWFMVGYEKDKNIYRKNLMFFVAFYTVSFLVFEYATGFILGLAISPWNHSFISIIKNTFMVVLIILLEENLRYNICKKLEKNDKMFVMTMLTFVLMDVAFGAYGYRFSSLQRVLNFIISVGLTSLFRNWILTDFAAKYGVGQNIVYRLILELYPYILPYIPNLGVYLDAIMLMVYPVLLRKVIYGRFEKEEKVDLRDKQISQKVLYGLSVTFAALVIALNSNMFDFWFAAVGSGSMEPTIMIGDGVIIDKRVQRHLDKLKVGDVLVFKVDDNVFTHRITSITVNGSQYSINTKGDRKGQADDSWVVTNDDVIGVVSFKIKYVGYPTVWLSRIMEGRK